MKKILFIAPNHFSIYERIIKEFKTYNYDVTSFILEDWKIKKTKSEKLLSFFHKLINPKHFYLKSESEIQKIIKSYPLSYFDIAFFIRPDYFSKESILKCINASKTNLAYQWDGLDRYTNIINKIDFFNKFLVFDKDDYSKYHTKHQNISIGSNFYFNSDSDIKKSKTSDVFYLGTFVYDRNKKMMTIYNQLKNLDLKINILLCLPEKNKEIIKEYSNDDIHFFEKIKKYSEMLSYTKNSKIIIDLLVEGHYGLSFRFFEALKYKNKIITTNPTVVNYDFYRPENIFVLDNNLDKIKDFIKMDYVDLPKEIVDKYSFINWFENNI